VKFNVNNVARLRVESDIPEQRMPGNLI